MWMPNKCPLFSVGSNGFFYTYLFFAFAYIPL
jgi:hypothetical protein